MDLNQYISEFKNDVMEYGLNERSLQRYREIFSNSAHDSRVTVINEYIDSRLSDHRLRPFLEYFSGSSDPDQLFMKVLGFSIGTGVVGEIIGIMTGSSAVIGGAWCALAGLHFLELGVQYIF